MYSCTGGYRTNSAASVQRNIRAKRILAICGIAAALSTGVAAQSALSVPPAPISDTCDPAYDAVLLALLLKLYAEYGGTGSLDPAKDAEIWMGQVASAYNANGTPPGLTPAEKADLLDQIADVHTHLKADSGCLDKTARDAFLDVLDDMRDDLMP